MARETPRALLLIDDEPAQTRLIGAIAARVGWRMHAVADRDAARQLLKAEKIDAVLIDSWVPGSDDGALVVAIRESYPDLPVLILTAQTSVDVAIAAMRAGANDYLVKPITADRLIAALSAVSAREDEGELRPLSEKIGQVLGFEEIVGSAPDFRAALAIAAKAARARVPVLIEGEPGVGKEVIARAIHAASPRGRRQMVTVNCAAIASNLIESELFGHERGAFPGAFERRIGRLVAADGGTLFLDEVGALPPDTQIRLLNLIQTGEVRPIGGRHSQFVDVRIIAANDAPLADAIASGQMREDLFYRLAVVQLTIPPLRARAGDVPALARHLLARIAAQPGMRRLGISDDALALLMAYDWPGNVRQLQNALFRAAVLCDGELLSADDFPHIAEAAQTPAAARGMAMNGLLAAGSGITLFEANGHLRPLEAIEADVIRLAIGHYRGRMTEVARRLGIGRSTLYRRLGELGIGDAA
ncbi:sigma-54-dependent transcriptional regulator [Flavisphingomonas formosensis]|uniref:sigma-54-dependent transcriptional regulator n=1 Tax=Flavisphingomonas formosensis TaxID=861534 RepID=UPI0012F71B23|nr:sigma-54 dependent transcriptional regulator [Sphingomonas formosensis]